MRRGNKSFDSSKGIHFKSKIAQDALLLLIGFLIGIISGLVGAGVIGAKFANDVSEEKLNKIVAVIFILLGIMMTAMKFVKEF